MAQEDAQEKTEAPTLKKREDAKKKGMLPISKEVPSAALLGAITLYFYVAGSFNLVQIENMWRFSFSNLITEDISPELLGEVFTNAVFAVMPVMLGIFGVIFIVGLFASFVQVGPVFTPLKFSPDRLNPLNGIKRIFSAQGLAELFKSVFKMGVIGYITFYSFQQEIAEILNLSQLSINNILTFNFNLLGILFGRVALALVILALLDLLFQRWNMEQKLKMTKQEMKEELKQTEGDPQLRARVRQVQKEMSRARMMENVPKSDVVVTNPTHYAVALSYDREIMTSPRLMAKGADFLAERIKAIAKENEVTIVENPEIARGIYTQVEIGEEVPEEFFKVVAEILAYVYRLKGKTVTPSA